jgi:hypothetical protein
MSSPFYTTVTTTPIPKIKNGMADLMSIAARLVYTLDISSVSTSHVSAYICRRQRQIMEVMMMFRLTLSETKAWQDE